MQRFKRKHWQAVAIAAPVALTIAGCNGNDDNGGPGFPTPSPSATATASGTPNATASATPSATPTGGTGSGPNVNVIALVQSPTGGATNSNGQSLSRFNASRLNQTLGITPLSGLGNARLLGIDFRPSTGELYGVGNDRRVYRINTQSGAATPLGGRFASTLTGTQFGIDFNPVPDRIRIVSDADFNARANPDTGALVDSDTNTSGLQLDGTLAYDSTDTNAGRNPSIVGAAYANNVAGATSTTNYAIDSRLGVLVTQGTAAGVATPVSPNTGRLFTVGSLGVPFGGSVGFDIGANNVALATGNNRLYSINLTTAAATFLGSVPGAGSSGAGTGGTVNQIVGLAIEP